jgi:hypothetical protein
MNRLLIVLACVGVAIAAQTQLVQLDAYADDSIRIRVAPAGGSITEPPLQVRFCVFALLLSSQSCSTDAWIDSSTLLFLTFCDTRTAHILVAKPHNHRR